MGGLAAARFRMGCVIAPILLSLTLHCRSSGVLLSQPGIPSSSTTCSPRGCGQSQEGEDHALGRQVACRAAYRFLSFELRDEGGEMRGNGGREGVVLILEALPNC